MRREGGHGVIKLEQSGHGSRGACGAWGRYDGVDISGGQERRSNEMMFRRYQVAQRGLARRTTPPVSFLMSDEEIVCASR
jgi:hypothetical protein